MDNSVNSYEFSFTEDIVTNSKNKRLVTTVDRNYNMNYEKQGFAYIFSHEYFTRHPQREGADIDVEKLERCLTKLGFEVHVFRDLKGAEIEYQVYKVTQKDHSNNNCIFMAVLSHGDNFQHIAAYDEEYDPSKMFYEKLKADQCPTLAGKPKLFFIQCCQGDKGVPGIDFYNKFYQTETDGGNSNDNYKIPVYGDFCIMYATARDHCAFRNPFTGSYFITALSEELTEHAYNEHLLTILTFVIRRVAVEFQSNSKNPNLHKKKQLPYFQSTLNKIVQFTDRDSGVENGLL